MANKTNLLITRFTVIFYAVSTALRDFSYSFIYFSLQIPIIQRLKWSADH
jgi:hypothetical protein